MKVATTKSIARLLVLWLAVLALASTTAAPARGASDLLADGTADALQLVRILPGADGAGIFSRVERRALPSGAWTQVTEIGGRAAGLTHLGRDAVLWLDTGDWWLGKALGPSLPDRHTVGLLAGDDAHLYAIGLPSPRNVATAPANPPSGSASNPTAGAPSNPTSAAPVNPPATAPANPTSAAPATSLATTAHATAAATPTPGLYRLDKSAWTRIADLPDSMPDRWDAARADLLAIDGAVTLVRLGADNTLHAATFDPAGGWTALPAITPPFPVSDLRLLDLAGKPVLWIAAASGPGALNGMDGQWNKSVALAMDADMSKVADRAVAVAAERIRLIFQRDGKLFERQFDAAANPIGPAAEVVLPKPPDQRILNAVQLAMMFALMFLLMGSMRRRPVSRDPLEGSGLTIARTWPRLAAGVVDALPYLVGMYLYSMKVDDTAAHLHQAVALPLWIGLGVYFLHITVMEMFRGQSLGKRIFGLRVVALDGAKARPGAILIRNAVLMIEVFLLFPLILVFYSPLRQRIGDITARTLVVSK